MPTEVVDTMGMGAPESVARQRFEDAWEAAELFAILNVFADQLVNPVSNEIWPR